MLKDRCGTAQWNDNRQILELQVDLGNRNISFGQSASGMPLRVCRWGRSRVLLLPALVLSSWVRHCSWGPCHRTMWGRVTPIQWCVLPLPCMRRWRSIGVRPRVVPWVGREGGRSRRWWKRVAAICRPWWSHCQPHKEKVNTRTANVKEFFGSLHCRAVPLTLSIM